MPCGDGKFDEIYIRFHPGILRFLTRMLGSDEAEDVAQEVFIKVDRGLPDFRGEAAIGTWIYAIARNAAMDRLRAGSRRLDMKEPVGSRRTEDAPGDLCAGLPDETASLERYLIGKEMNACIRERVESLPEMYRTVLILGELAGMTNSEIADSLGTTEGAVKIRLHRARAMLRNDLGRRCALYRDERNELGCEPRTSPLAL